MYENNSKGKKRMKIAKRLLPLLVFVFALIGIGCSLNHKPDIEAVITKELDAFTDPDSYTAQKYISYKTLFPDAAERDIDTTIADSVFSIFFQDFEYKILDIDVDNTKHQATAKIRLSTPDANSLARDFTISRLEFQLRNAVCTDAQSTDDISCSLEECYQILHELLVTNDYKSTKTECYITLHCTSKQNQTWEIVKTSALENDLVGGLLAYLSDTDLLSPEDTLSVYFQTLKHMNPDEMSAFLGIESILNSSDSVKNEIAFALVDKVHTTFDYEIKNCTIDGYTAYLDVSITTFDSNSILESYSQEFEEYMSTPEAVYDGSMKRYEKSVEVLLEKIESCESLVTSDTSFCMINDGLSWKLDDNDHILGNAIFGTLSTNPTLNPEL